jgi:TatD DNase family protein
VLTDTHCHLNLEIFDDDREEVIKRATQVGVEKILIPGLALSSSISAVNLVQNHATLYAAIGVHPTEIGTFRIDTVERLHKLASENTCSSVTSKIIAIGEIGLDYYWDFNPHDQQQEVFKEQLALAADLQIPVVIHFRERGDTSGGECASDLLSILEAWVLDLKRRFSTLVGRTGVLHSFSGTLAMAKAAIELGFYIGISGPVTYKTGQGLGKLVKALELDRILVETDSPFQTPFPHRGKRNEPTNVRLIADKIAFVHNTTIEKVALVTSKNARRLFAWE